MKFFKRLLLCTLSALTVFFACDFCQDNVKGSAEVGKFSSSVGYGNNYESTQYPLSNDDYEFVSGAAVDIDDLVNLRYILKIKNPVLTTSSGYSREYIFTLNTLSENGAKRKLAELVYLYKSGWWNAWYIYYDMNYAYFPDAEFNADNPHFDLAGASGCCDNVFWLPTELSPLIVENSFIWLNHNKLFSTPIGAKKVFLGCFSSPSGSCDLPFNVDLDSIGDDTYGALYINLFNVDRYEDYCVDFKYSIKQTSKKKVVVNTLQSSNRSVRYVVEKAVEAGELSEENETVAEILDYTNNVTVPIEYLERIGNSPFARFVSKNIAIDYLGSYITPETVSNIWEDTSWSQCLGSNVIGFKLVDDVYRAVYCDAVFLNVKTEDGGSHQVSYALSLNYSFNDYFGKLSNDPDIDGHYDLIDKGLIASFYNEYMNKYPEVSPAWGITASNIYGYWGVAVTPNVSSVNAFVQRVLDSDVVFSNIDDFTVKRYVGTLSTSNFESLCEDYNYGYFKRLGTEIKDFFSGKAHQEGTFYMFAVPYAGVSVIGENGSGELSNSSSLIQNGLRNIFGNLNIKSILAILLVLLLILFLILNPATLLSAIIAIITFPIKLLGAIFGKANKKIDEKKKSKGKAKAKKKKGK